MRLLAALLAGLLFGLGLTISGMVNPAKILSFLDVAGQWDPSLALVMAAAVPVAALGFAAGRKRRTPIFAAAFMEPAKSRLDARLVSGAMLFGIGWGLAGFCPGPALASLGFGGWRAVLFVVAMVAGMAAFSGWDRLAAGRSQSRRLTTAPG